MASNTKLIHNGVIVNELTQFNGYITLDGDTITAVEKGEPSQQIIDLANTVIDAHGAFIMPGAIDDQVHFREPGLTDKASIATESKAAIAGGVTSFMEMPNTTPATTNMDALANKIEIAENTSYANYSFYLGATNNNADVVAQIDPKTIPGVKIFMGSSTGNMLVDRQKALEQIFAESPVLIATHCEEESIIQENLKQAYAKLGDEIPFEMHPVIRSNEACVRSTDKAISLAIKYSARLNVLHISTKEECTMFGNTLPLADKKITAEVCAHHLWFESADYTTMKGKVKCNPAVKTKADRDALREALACGKLDILATDHAPHLLEQKLEKYTTCPSGLPLVQHSMPMMMEMYTPEQVVQFMAHNPAIGYKVDKRGFLKVGYKADIVIVENKEWAVTKSNILYKCGWSPLEGHNFKFKVAYTILNGEVVYQNGVVSENRNAQQLRFDR